MIRQLIREILIFEKDEEKIKSKIITRGADTTNYQVNPDVQDYKTRDADPKDVKSEKELKRIWAEEVIEEKSRNFFDNELIKVHFINALFQPGKSRADTPGFVKEQHDGFRKAVEFVANNSSKSRDEISCLGYLPGDVLAGNVKDKIGIIVKGWTTYASTNDAATHMPSMASDELRAKKRGLHKRPAARGASTSAFEMAVDKESFLGRSGDYHEVIVDNWIPTGVVIHSDFFKKEAAHEASIIKDIAKENFNDKPESYDSRRPGDSIWPRGPNGVRIAKEERIKYINILIERGVDVFDENFVKYQKIRIPYEFFDKSALASAWSGLLDPGTYLSNEPEVPVPNIGGVHGDPDKSELAKYGPDLQITKKNLRNINFSNITKNLNFTFCDLVPHFKDMTSRKISMFECSLETVSALAPSIEDCGNTDFIFQFSDIGNYFTVEPFGAKSLTFGNCKFRTEVAANDQIIKTLAKFKNPITFDNCEPSNVEEIVNQVRLKYQESEKEYAASKSTPSRVLPGAPVEPLFYFGPSTSAPVEATVADIVGYIQANPSADHQVYFNRSWVLALEVPEVAKELSRLGPKPPSARPLPPLPPLPPPLSELRMLRRLIKDYL